ncbi:MAG: adenylate/guanylate cyclase domain-containing protein, partial [Ilumatobacteraceae bacterium]
MTFLFTDIVGSTRQWEESPEMHDRVEQHFAVLRAAVEDGGGEVFATMGDGIAAAFTSVDGALRASVAAQHAMPPTGLAVRMGIHTGEVEPVGDDYRGRAVNRAARIMAVGHGGQILLSDVSAALVRSGTGRAVLTDLGAHRLRDLTEPERVWQVVHPDLPEQFPPVRGVDTYSNNLPAQRSSLVGRDLEVQRIVAMTRRHRIVTLTGVGGVGKTRLAVQSAAELLTEFATVWFVELACVTDPDDVADTIARTVGAVGVPDPLAAAAAALAGARRLLVLDNCEHVVDRASAAVDVLTAACPELSIVATSREVLGVDGEHVLAVRPLDPATTAGELFRQRAMAAGVELATLEPASIAELCRRLDGLPLAIELAAARTATLGVAAIVGALDDQLGLGSGGRRRGEDRHSTMRATIEWSYRLLDVDEQQLFRWLAVFPNGFELDAARHVACLLGIDEAAATEHVASLVHKSMVTPESHPHGVRYRMLETMRAFAAERLDELDERLSAFTALADWVATITDLPFAHPCNAVVERNVLRLEREPDNWREAVVTATRLRSGELAAALCGPPVAFFLLGRHDLADVLRPLLELCEDGEQRRAVVTALIVSASGGTEPAQMRAWADEVAAFDDLDPTGLGGLMRWFASAWRGDFVTAIEVCVEASRDRRLERSTRDLFVGIAVLDHFSLTDACADTYGLIPRALEVAERSDVALHRATCLLGAAWGLAGSEPDRALDLVRRAINEVPQVPALTRLTLPGSAARLLTRLDPSVAARGLLEQLDATPSRRSFVDLIPLFYAAAMLDGLGNGSAGEALVSVTSAPIAPQQSMMDFVDLARRAAATSNVRSVGELEVTVRAALRDIVA